MPVRLGIIRVLTTGDPELLREHGRLIEQQYYGVSTLNECIFGQLTGVHDEPTEQAASLKVPVLARQLADRGVDAVIVSCCADPGVSASKASLSIPVIGAGRAAAALALSYGGKAGVLGLIPGTPTIMRKVLGSAWCGDDSPLGVNTTLDLLTERGKQACIDAALRLRDRGAEVICLACTGMSTIGLPALLREILNIPVVCPVLAAAGVAIAQVCQRGVI